MYYNMFEPYRRYIPRYILSILLEAALEVSTKMYTYSVYIYA